MKVLDRHAVKEATNMKALENVIPDDMKMYTLDIVFKKKWLEIIIDLKLNVNT